MWIGHMHPLRSHTLCKLQFLITNHWWVQHSYLPVGLFRVTNRITSQTNNTSYFNMAYFLRIARTSPIMSWPIWLMGWVLSWCSVYRTHAPSAISWLWRCLMSLSSSSSSEQPPAMLIGMWRRLYYIKMGKWEEIEKPINKTNCS